uniref:Vacuolar protein sorting 13 homolog C n=1 Tax=Electrophorus electricus TaxID=8005 RepID=A0A4W4GIM2_ELEEL
MVFESLVSDLLNRFIGDYVENLDKSQLKIGIWGGKQTLVKQHFTLFQSELDVPFKVKAGQVGKLTLKIPWKNLYSEAVVATLDGLYLLVVPGATIKYDAAKEERYLQEVKQKELQRIEEALQLAAQKPQEDKKDTFAEKLATQVIKNLQVKITSIHVRYEDDISDPERPLSVGVTLSELSLQTTDENWRTCILNEAAKLIYKLGCLECLCAYWNVNSPMFCQCSREEAVVMLLCILGSAVAVFKPIFASAKMCINPNAEVELKSPKASFQLEVQNIAIEMTKPQYLSMVDLLESVDLFNIFGADWWRYAISSVLEVNIKRYKEMWSWTHIRKHRQTLKAYKTAHRAKLSQSKVREDTEKQILELEKRLDVFNITLARQQAQMEVQGPCAAPTGGGGGGGFLSSFFGRKEGKKREQEEEMTEQESIDTIMTAEEKAKLYTAIGYSESSHNLTLPKDYVAVIMNFKLLRTSVTVREEIRVPEILKVQMIDLSTTISQRPGAQAIKVEASLEHWFVTGLQQQGQVPSLIASVGDSCSSLLSVLFELNPEDSPADQLLHVHSQPVEMIYDALTINSLADFFKTGKGVDLEVITSATLSKLEEIKEKTASGLSHIIETRKVLDLRIDLKPSYLLVPKSGFYQSKSDLIIIDFGSLQLNSVDQGSHQQISASFSSLEEIMDRAYERFSLELRSVQVLYSKSGESWKSARTQSSSIQHILRPMDFTLNLAKCIVEKDSRMPRFKVSGELPLLHVKISDQKIQGVLELVDSIPLPHPVSTPPSSPTHRVQEHTHTHTYRVYSEEDTSERSPDEDGQRSVQEDLTDVQFKFEIKTVLLELTRQTAMEETVLALNVCNLGAEGKMRTYDFTVTSYLRKINLDYCETRGADTHPLHLISSSDKHGSDLLKVEYIKADVSGPSFQGLFDNTEQTLKVEFSSLMFMLHTSALLSTINYLNTAVPQDITASRVQDTRRQADRTATGKTVSKGGKTSTVVRFKLCAMLGSFGVVVCDDRSNIADIRVQGIDASVVVQAKETEVFARLRDIIVLDVDPKTIHKKAVSIVGEEVFSFKMILYPGATEGNGYSDVTKVDSKVTLRVGCIQIVYLHKFLMSLLTFVDNFQTAKEALSAATAQAAEKAASSVRDFAQKSFRLSMDIRLKAPLIIIPQSSMSHDALVVDLGLINVSNSFALLQAEGFPLPAVQETMDIKLTHLKLSRLMRDDPQADIQILQPVNLELLVKRNLAASWFTKIPGVEVKGGLKSMNVTFSSLDLMLHTEVLLSIMDFLSAAMSSKHLPALEKDARRSEDVRTISAKSMVVSSPSDGDVIDLKVDMRLGAFSVLVCDQSCNMADIKIQGLHGALLLQGTQTHMSARLRDFIVINVDPKTIHKKAISIVGDEVFSFSLSLTPKATEGAGYTDTSKVDGKIRLSVGCIQVVYLHKFTMSLLNFSNNFQMAKEALSTATAQAAEKAASSVRDFAQKSFRLSMDIRLKAPLIIIPQSSMSHNAVEADLGLITVSNSFALLPVEGCPLPAVIDDMNLELTQLKLSRTELLQPVNMVLSVRRNLAASWYQDMAGLELDGDLKPMKVALSQDDLTVLLKILTENISEASSVQPPQSLNAAGKPAPVAVTPHTLIGNIHTAAHTLEDLCLGEFMLCKMKATGKMFNNSSLEVSTILTTCSLDDRRANVERVTSRWRDEESSDAMIDVTFSQCADERSVVAVLQKLYLCASVEFLMAVADFFIQALPQAPPLPSTTMLDKPSHLSLKQLSERQDSAECPVMVDPEVVFVASLVKAESPALVSSFQCDVSVVMQQDTQLTANVRGLKVLACPFIRKKDSKAVTTVLRPCSVVLEARKSGHAPLTGSVTVQEVIVKVSPVILNTVMTITAAMTPKPLQEQTEKTEDVCSLWAVRNIYSCNHWFLGVESATEAVENFREADSSSQEGESFKVEVKVVQVTVESGQGHRTTPLLLAESSFSGCARNWSSLLSLSADMTLEVNYFNETHAVWEPFIERVDNGTRRWNLTMKTNPVRDKSPVPGDDFIMLPDPCTAISICSKDTMNITVSKCCLNVFHNLAQAFSESTASTFDPTVKEKAPFTIRNALGIPLLIQHSANLCMVKPSAKGKVHEVAVGESVDLEYSIFESSSRGKLSALQRQESCLFNLSIVPVGYSEISSVPVDKPGRRLYNVRQPGAAQAVSVLLQINASDGNKVMTVRSPLQIKNHFSVPFAVVKFSPEMGGLLNVGVAEPQKEFHVTLDTYRSQLFLLPVGSLEGFYSESTTCITWKEQVHVSSEVRSVLQCPARDSSCLPLVITALAVPDVLRHISSQGEDDWDPAYVIHLHPAITLRNLLPYTLRYLLEGSAESHELQEGISADILNARLSGQLMELVLVGYQGRTWTSHVQVSEAMAEFSPVCFTSDTSEQLSVDLCVHVTRGAGRLVLSVFSPYWIINKTSRVLQYRADDAYVKHPADFRDVILFSFKKKNIFSKNKLQLCVSTSSWSDGFSLDTVGSYGCVRCSDRTMDYLVGVSIQMSSFNLTRIVTMSPFYTLVNKSCFELEVGEVQNGKAHSGGKWHYISSTECLPLWPESSTGRLCVRVVGSESASKSFFFNKQDNGTLLSMEQYGGIIVDVNISDHSTVVSFSDYYEGAAPALLVNHTPWVTISVRQRSLNPGESLLFAWNDPAGERKLCWTSQGHSGELDLLKDECGQFAYDGLAQVHWVSFLDGRQRVLLFTEDVAVVTKARQAEELEQFQQEVTVSLQNLGLSLINNDHKQEIAYVGITSSGVVWEMRPKNRWKSFNCKNISLLERAYQDHVSGITEPGWVKLETGLEVNFARIPMLMRHPFSCSIRRNFLSGIHVELKQSPHQRSLRAQLHWLQVDNQLPGAMFPIVFHPVPPPKSVALDSEPKPFIDMSIITRFNEHSQVMQFKYFMMLVQEMAVKVDQGFLAAVLALFTPVTDTQEDKQKTALIERDLEALQAQLMESSINDTSGLSFFEHFHISPIKLHLSLSLGSSGEDHQEGDMVAIQSVNLLLKSIGATLTDVDDLIFKLACFEVKYQFYRREKLMWAVIRHYSEQFLKQMYVLVLGLDVLGNPFGLIRGLSEGVEAFFYEPFQGAVQGPEEFAEGFVIGVRSLLGHTVGGAAGMVSRITGSVGKGLAAITMDKEYQQKRREEMNRPPRDFGDSLAKGGKGLLKGVVGGVTGIVTKPVEGAKREGAAGFFKGIGKGLVGVVTRPTAGIVDMASSTFQGIQRVAESTEDVTKLRPVRLIREDGIIRPYEHHESHGYDLFQVKQLDGELFREHFEYPGHRKTNIIVTNRRVMCIKEIDLIGHFNKEWEVQFDNFLRPPYVEGGDLKIYYKILKDGQGPVRVVHLRQTDMAEVKTSEGDAPDRQNRG